MTHGVFSQVGSLIVFAVISFFLANPFHQWMPNEVHMALLASAVAAFGAFAIFVLRESTGDERENEHRSFAGRVAFLAGSAALLLGIVIQSLAHTLDPWLLVALLVMLVGKTVAHFYSSLYR